jgi:hypothetical protein
VGAIDDVSDGLNSQPKPNQALMKAIQFQASQLIAREWVCFVNAFVELTLLPRLEQRLRQMG